jgi:hypothetical protein
VGLIERFPCLQARSPSEKHFQGLKSGQN